MRAGPSVEIPVEQPREAQVDPLAPKPTDSELLQLLKEKIRRLPTLEKDMPDAARESIIQKYVALREELASGMAALDDNEIKEINEGFESRIKEQERKTPTNKLSEPLQAMRQLIAHGNSFLADKARQGSTFSNIHDGVRSGVQSAALWSAVTRFIPGPWGIAAGIATGIGGTYITAKLGRFLSRFGIKEETGAKIAQWVTAAGATAAATVGTVATGGLGALGTIGLIGGLGGLSMYANRALRKGNEDEAKAEIRAKLLEKLRREQEEAERQMQQAVKADPAGAQLPGGTQNPSGNRNPEVAPTQLAA